MCEILIAGRLAYVCPFETHQESSQSTRTGLLTSQVVAGDHPYKSHARLLIKRLRSIANGCMHRSSQLHYFYLRQSRKSRRAPTFLFLFLSFLRLYFLGCLNSYSRQQISKGPIVTMQLFVTRYVVTRSHHFVTMFLRVYIYLFLLRRICIRSCIRGLDRILVIT